MPAVLREDGYRFFFVSLDRSEPPHVHVKRETRLPSFGSIRSSSASARSAKLTASRFVLNR
jgi:hypothetical protein